MTKPTLNEMRRFRAEPVDWPRILRELNWAGITLEAMAPVLGVTRGALSSWKTRGVEPRHHHGDTLLALHYEYFHPNTVSTKPSTASVRDMLANGARSLREIADGIGIRGPNATERIAPLLWQMEHRTGEVVKIPGSPNRYALAAQQTALLREWGSPAAVRRLSIEP